MYAKIFTQIYDSSIVEHPDVRFTFMDMLVLADINGVVDMTHEAIARRTNRPIAVIRSTIAVLEAPDDRSRTPTASGSRLARLDKHRDWGWIIVNYEEFRKIASEEQRREKTRERTRKWRENEDLPISDAPVTHSDAGDAMQKQKQKKREREREREKKEDSGLSLPASIGSPEMQAAWLDWQEHRKEKRKPLTPLSAKRQIEQFQEWGIPRSIAAIKHSILKGWQGIYEQKNDAPVYRQPLRNAI